MIGGKGEQATERRTADAASSSTPKVSVVLGTYNRPDSLLYLLSCLARQSLPASQFEVIVVDDGSKVPARERVNVRDYPFSLTILDQANASWT